MKKKTMSFLMACVMVLSLVLSAPFVRANAADGEITHIVLTNANWFGGQCADTDKVEEAINQITREKIGVEVEIMTSDLSAYSQNINLALASGEQLDLIVCLGVGYSSLVSFGYLTDLNENDLLETYGQGIIEALGRENINGCTIDGKLYGLPNNRDWAVGHGCFSIRNDLLAEIGFEKPEGSPEILRVTQEELDELLAKIHEKFPDIETFRPAGTFTSQFMDIDAIGGNVFGVLLDYGKEPVVENLFTSEAYMTAAKKFHEYFKAGYISMDAATDTTSVTSLVTSGVIASYNTGGKPGIVAQEAASGVPVTVFQTKEDFVSSSALVQFPWAIPYTSADPAAAMKFLNELYTNPEVANLLAYGIEGEHYNLNADGLVEIVPNPGYQTVIWDSPNEFILHVLVGNDPDVWEKTREFNNNAKRSVADGFLFDPANVSAEIVACQNVYSEYQKSIEYGLVDPEKAIPELNNRMMAAGLEKIIAEKQAQLDAFLAGKETQK